MSRFGAKRGLLCLVMALCGSQGAFAQTTGSIVGFVRDAANAPLANASVSLVGPVDRTTQSDALGAFVFGALPYGEYEVQATLDGFAPATQKLRLVSGDRVSVELKLWVVAFEKVVVTAAKSGELDAQAIPIAVSVVSGDELRRAGARSVEDVAGLVPSVTFSQNTGFGQLTIRGIGTNVVFAGSDPSSAVYVDGVYLARPSMVLMDFLDVERVEALRGPQGTLYGRNAVGGAFNVVTLSPADKLEAAARVSVGDFRALRVEARIAGPVSPRKLTASAAVLRGVSEGFVRDLNHPDHPLGGEDVTAVRGKLRARFGARADLLVAGDVSHQDPTPLTYAKVLAVKPGFEVNNPQDPHEVRASTIATSRNLQWGTSVRVKTLLGAGTTLQSLTAFRQLDYDVLADTDITELDVAASRIHEIQHQWSEELTISGKRGGVTWISGAFLLKDNDQQPTAVRFAGRRLENRLDPRVEASSAALFGQGTVALTRRLSLTAGVRHTRERKTIENAGGLLPFDQPATPIPGSAYSYKDATSHSAWTPKLGLEWRLSELTLAYGSATRGFKSGGFNISSPEMGRGYAPEWAWSYEVGLKSTLAGGRARVTLAAFQTDYTDLQVQTAIRPGVIDISNAAGAKIRGVEAEGVWHPVRALKVGGHLAWLDARYNRYLAVGVGVTGDVSGNRLSNAPEWSGHLWIECIALAGRAGTLSLRAASPWQSVVFYTPFNDDVQRQRAYGILNLSAELGPLRWSIGVHAKNLLDGDFITGSFASPPPAVGGRPGHPRQIEVRMTLRR